VDLSQTVIFLTSNLGGGEITELMHGGMGFVQPGDTPAAGLDLKVERTAVEAARRKFSPEFMNGWIKRRFHPLRREQLKKCWTSSWAGAAARAGDRQGSVPVRVTLRVATSC